MYTIEDLEFSITRLKQLRIFLKDKEYDHRFFHDCGTPSCALGWASVLFPEELTLYSHVCEINKISSISGYGVNAGLYVFKINTVIAQYLFAFSVTASNKTWVHRRDNDISKETTIKKLMRVEEYFRRKLASLLAEQESKTIHHKVVEQPKVLN